MRLLGTFVREDQVSLSARRNLLQEHAMGVTGGKGKSGDIVLLSLLAVSLSLNVFLGWKVKKRGTTSVPSKPSTVTGSAFPPLLVRNINNVQETIEYSTSGVPTVLYLFSPTCVWCERNQANIDAVAKMRGGDYRFLTLALNEVKLREYLDSRSTDLPVFKGLARDTMKELGLGGTPQTIVVSPEGRVIKNWSGAYGPEILSEVEVFFGVRLPGITSKSGSGSDGGAAQSCE